ncbi:MAG: class II fructose-bisphosphate aldolase [Candidatus Paceibacterota bacterium]
MKSLREILVTAQKNNQIVWHFNVASYEQLEAVARVSQKRNMPFLVGVSEGERTAWGVHRIAHLIQLYRAEGIELFLNADHTHSLEKIQEAVSAGFDEVLFDAGKKNLAENILETKKVVAWVKEYNALHGTDVLVEGELGYIGSSSVLLHELPPDISTQTTLLEAQEFCAQTGVDLYAPALGNIHGILHTGVNPMLNIELLKNLTQNIATPMVLHGGSGTPNLKEAMRLGVRVIHISTELRIAWREGFVSALAQHPQDIVPYHILPEVVSSIEKIIEEKIDL